MLSREACHARRLSAFLTTQWTLPPLAQLPPCQAHVCTWPRSSLPPAQPTALSTGSGALTQDMCVQEPGAHITRMHRGLEITHTAHMCTGAWSAHTAHVQRSGAHIAHVCTGTWSSSRVYKNPELIHCTGAWSSHSARVHRGLELIPARARGSGAYSTRVYGDLELIYHTCTRILSTAMCA